MYTQIILRISQELYERARRLARHRNQDVADVLADSIVLDDQPVDLESLYPGVSTEKAQVMAREENAFRQLHAQLKQQVPGQFVAIYNGNLFDHDQEFAVLLKRVRQQLPDKFVWISPVKDEPEEMFHFRSPRLVS